MDQPTLRALAAFPQALEELYRSIPDGYTHWAPSSWEGIPSETFTPIEQICHIRDIELDGYRVRFQRTLAEDSPALPSLDSYRLAKERDYSKADAVEVFVAFCAARAETLRLLTSLTPAELERTAVFEGYGPVTVRGLAHYLCSHDQQHLAGLQWLLGNMYAGIPYHHHVSVKQG